MAPEKHNRVFLEDENGLPPKLSRDEKEINPSALERRIALESGIPYKGRSEEKEGRQQKSSGMEIGAMLSKNPELKKRLHTIGNQGGFEANQDRKLWGEYLKGPASPETLSLLTRAGYRQEALQNLTEEKAEKIVFEAFTAELKNYLHQPHGTQLEGYTWKVLNDKKGGEENFSTDELFYSARLAAYTDTLKERGISPLKYHAGKGDIPLRMKMEATQIIEEKGKETIEALYKEIAILQKMIQDGKVTAEGIEVLAKQHAPKITKESLVLKKVDLLESAEVVTKKKTPAEVASIIHEIAKGEEALAKELETKVTGFRLLFNSKKGTDEALQANFLADAHLVFEKKKLLLAEKLSKKLKKYVSPGDAALAEEQVKLEEEIAETERLAEKALQKALPEVERIQRENKLFAKSEVESFIKKQFTPEKIEALEQTYPGIKLAFLRGGLTPEGQAYVEKVLADTERKTTDGTEVSAIERYRTLNQIVLQQEKNDLIEAKKRFESDYQNLQGKREVIERLNNLKALTQFDVGLQNIQKVIETLDAAINLTTTDIQNKNEAA
jgi:hypothetical protein